MSTLIFLCLHNKYIVKVVVSSKIIAKIKHENVHDVIVLFLQIKNFFMPSIAIHEIF